MPRIRDYESDQRATGPLTEGGASAAAFGGRVGAAASELGDALATSVRSLQAHTNRADGIDADLRASKLRRDFTVRYFDLQNGAQPGARDFAKSVNEEFDKMAATAFDGASAGASKAGQTKIEHLRTTFFDNAVTFEAKAGTHHIKDNADEALKTLQNVVTLDPTAYEDALKDGSALIDKMTATADVKGLPADIASTMKRQYIEAITNDYFDGKIKGAKTAADLEAVMTEMADAKYKDRLDPKNTATLLNHARTVQHSLATQATTAARAAVSAIKDRMTAGDKLDEAEIASVDKAVKDAGNPSVFTEWEKHKAYYRALTTGRQMPKEVVDQASLDERGLPGKPGDVRFQSLPAELNDAVNLGARLSGGQISAEFLAKTMVREAGSDIAKLKRGSDAFAPKAGHEGVDIQNVRPAVRDAAAVAGQIFGEPLVLTSGHRSQAKQDAIRAGRLTPFVAIHSNHTTGTAIDISTQGWAPERKAKLVDALVQAGFTGFGEYEGHIHADFRANVPGSFDAKMLFGGWTKLSPEVAETLTKRGFSAGAAAGRVNRLQADGTQFKGNTLNFDFEAGRHPDGRLLSSARGPFQFLEGTWREYLPQAAKAYGIDLSGKSDEELMRLRADPKVAGAVYTYYSLQNKKVMEASLKRPINESELYMGHLMGATGASAFLKAWTVQPNAPVSEVLSPDAINANKSVFLSKDGSPKSVGQVYAEISAGFNNGIDALAHERSKAFHTVQTEMAALNKPHGDPVSYAAKYGAMRPSDLNDAAGFASRGEQALRLQELYKLDFPKPLTNDEVADYKRRIEEGSVAEAVAALRDIGRFGGQSSEGAAKQLSEHSAFTAHVAGLFAKGGVEAQVAEDIIRGKREIKDNPSSKDWLHGAGEGGTGRKFDAYVGKAFDGLDPAARAAAKEAADAYYVHKFATRGDGAFSDSGYRQAIDATLGNRLGVVNGEKTVVPAGVTGPQFDTAVDQLTDADLTALSVTGDLPIDAGGRPLKAHDISIEAKFVHVGGEEYAVRMGDGKFAITGDVNENGTPVPYRMHFDAQTVADLLKRQPPERAGHYFTPQPPVSPEERERLKRLGFVQ